MHAPSDTASHADEDVVPGPRLGEILLADGSVTERELHAALDRQRDEGGDLGEHLVVDGAASRLEVYRALAEQWGLPLRNLLQDPPDAAVATSVRHREALQLGWLACEERAGRLVVATTRRPDESLLEEVAVRFGPLEVDLVATTRWDLFRAVERLHGPAIRRQSASVPGPVPVPPHGAVAPTQVPVQAPHAYGAVLLGLALACAVLVLLVLGARRGAELTVACAGLLVLAWVTTRVVAAFRLPRGPAGPTVDRIYSGHDRALPVYTVLMPAVTRRQDADAGADAAHDDLVASVESLAALDYPSTRLDVVVLLHEHDDAAAEHLRRSRPAANVRIVVVPDSAAGTTNQACNYGLAFARGRFVVRYDPGDHPERDQLRRAVAAFDRGADDETEPGADGPRPLACVQADVHPRRGTGLASVLEASDAARPVNGPTQHDQPLPAGFLQRSSHHVDTDVLRAVGAWHPALAAEAVDLGLRITRHGHRVARLTSATTTEPAPSLRRLHLDRSAELTALARTVLVALSPLAQDRTASTTARRPARGHSLPLLGRAVLPLVGAAAWPVLLAATILLGAARLLGVPDTSAGLALGFSTLLVVHVASAVAAARAATALGGRRGLVAALLDPVGVAEQAVAAWVAAVRTLRSAKTD